MQSLCANAIQKAILAIEHNGPGSWCMPLVDALESLHEGSSTKWCAEVISRVLAPRAMEEDAKTLVDLQRLVDSELSAGEVRERIRDIWYAREERTGLQTATSKLYEAVAAWASGDRQRYKRGVALTVSETAVGGTATPTDERVQQVLETFNRQCEQLQANGRARDDRQH